MSNLNKQQTEAINTVSGPVRIIAGAGSGKTTVLTERICNLVINVGTPSNRILAITFTNKAAHEMKERLRKKLDKDLRLEFVTTFHSFCLRVLKEDIDKLGWSKKFIILDEEDQKSLVREVVKSLGIDKAEYETRSILNHVSAFKNGFDTLDQYFVAFSGNPYEKKMSKIVEAYLTRQQQIQALDFDDLLKKCVELFKESPETLTKWRGRFDYFMVDEFQDTNDMQYELVKMLSLPSQQLFVVGDPDQTIYTWRGANIDLIMNLERDYPGLKTIILNQNYRSTKTILSSANSLIQNNENRISKDLFSENDAGTKIEYYSADSSSSEALWIVGEIQKLIDQGVAKKQIVVLYRSNFSSREIEQKLIGKQIQYQIIGGFKFYQRKEIKDALSYLRAIELFDDIAIKRIINIPSRKISEETVEKIEDYANRYGISFWVALQKIDSIDVSSIGKSACKSFIDLMNSMNMYQSASMIEKFNLIMEKSGYNEYVANDLVAGRADNINELRKALEVFEANNPEFTITDFLNEVSLYSSADESSKENCITLMTIHAAKGLEFEYVFIAALSEGVFPSRRNVESDAIEEERRIAYVAITRAKKALFISSTSEFSFVAKENTRPSRFIKEIGSNNINLRNQERVKGLFGNRFLDRESSYGNNYKTTEIGVDLSEKYAEKVDEFVVGEYINHTVFGDGIIEKAYGKIIEVAFAKPHGLKTLISSHKSISKKKH